MKKFNFLILIASIFLFSACEYKIIDSKPGEPIDPVSNLNYTISGSNVILTWNLPASYPDDIIKPVSVLIRITANGNPAGTVTIGAAPENYTFTSYNPANTYRITVKVTGNVDTTDPNFSNVRFSPGITVVL